MVETLFDGNPADHGFVMPAEWQQHACTWIAWPHNRDTWSKNLEAAQFEFIEFALRIALDEPTVVLIPDEDQAEIFTRMIADRPTNSARNIWTMNVPTNDAWMRDYGPTFVTDEKRIVAIDWQYNAWGGKYPPFDDDQKVVRRCLKDIPPMVQTFGPVARKVSQLCIEGGAIEIDDNHVLMCTTSCALDANRNPDWNQLQVEQELKSCLGAKHVIWLDGRAIAGDDTDGHIDQLARFVPGNKIVIASAESTDDQHSALQSNLDQLQHAIKNLQLDYELVPLPLPDPIYFGEMRLPASYCNFYITNHSVIVPQFSQPPADTRALNIIGDLFPNRKVIGLPSYNLTVGLGSFHCLSQQQPAIS